MPRQMRVQYPGAIYHAMSRGDRREAIFLDQEDRMSFIQTLGEASETTSWHVHTSGVQTANPPCFDANH